MADNNDILFEKRGGLGIITLNRPQALNAHTLDMLRLMHAQMDIWAQDDDVRCVMIEGAGNRAFCAGGDVKAVALDTEGAYRRDFFREEYTLNHRIHKYPKPFIALVDGICMGGGVGVSWHGSHRVVTENTVFAMPETGIGFFPDIGASHLMPRCPGQTGIYLALTGKHINVLDSIYMGFGTHYVPSKKLPDLVYALAGQD